MRCSRSQQLKIGFPTRYWQKKLEITGNVHLHCIPVQSWAQADEGSAVEKSLCERKKNKTTRGCRITKNKSLQSKNIDGNGFKRGTMMAEASIVVSLLCKVQLQVKFSSDIIYIHAFWKPRRYARGNRHELRHKQGVERVLQGTCMRQPTE